MRQHAPVDALTRRERSAPVRQPGVRRKAGGQVADLRACYGSLARAKRRSAAARRCSDRRSLQPRDCGRRADDGRCDDPTRRACQIEQGGGLEPLDGRVRLVEPGAFTKVYTLGVQEQRVWVVIDLVSPYDLRATLGDGFRVDAAIVNEESDDARPVPQSTLFRRGGG